VLGFLPEGFGTRELLLRAGLAGGIALAVYLGVAAATGMPELRTILAPLRRRARGE